MIFGPPKILFQRIFKFGMWFLLISLENSIVPCEGESEEPEAVFSPERKRTRGGICWRRPSRHLGKFDASMGRYTVGKCGPKRVCHRGSACLVRVGMKTKGWLGDRGRSRIVLERGKEGITWMGKPE